MPEQLANSARKVGSRANFDFSTTTSFRPEKKHLHFTSEDVLCDDLFGEITFIL
jgi:hypothetical protein